MSEYLLSVVRKDPNPKYDAEKEEQRCRYSQPGWQIEQAQSPMMDTRMLDVVLTEEEWERVKRAVVEGWK